MSNIVYEQSRDIQAVIRSVKRNLGGQIRLTEHTPANVNLLGKLHATNDTYRYILELFDEDYPDPFVEKYAELLKEGGEHEA